MSEFEAEKGVDETPPQERLEGVEFSARDLELALQARDEEWEALFRTALGLASTDEGYAERLALFWEVLNKDSLADEERELLARSHGAVDTRNPIDQLVELRIRRALAAAHESAPALEAALPHVLLARGEEPFLQGGALVRLSSGVAVAGGGALDKTIPEGTLIQLSEEDRLSLSQASIDFGDVDAASSIEELEMTYVGQGLASSAGRQNVSQTVDQLKKGGVLPSLVLTDQMGLQTLSASLEIEELDILSDSQQLSDFARTRNKDTGSSSVDTGEALRAVNMSRSLDNLERIMLWSVESSKRDQLLKRSLRGNLRGAVLSNKYVIEKQMGRGGFGTVYQARDKILDVNVAVKVLNPNIAKKQSALSSFLAEAQRLTAVDHPNIVRWITFDRTADGLHYFVMEHLDGQELAEVLEAEGPMEPSRAGEILLQVLAALRSAHQLPGGSELLHLDLKPQNVFIVKGSEVEGERAKVIDFGISRFSQDKRLAAGMSTTSSTGSEGSGTGTSGTPTKGTIGGMTARRVLGGTIPYSSPEQCRHIIGDEEIEDLDGRTDIYSFGVMAFQMLTGEMPFTKSKTLQEAAVKHIAIKPKKVLEVNKAVPRRFAEFVDKCLEKKPSDRWASADEAHRALDRIVHPAPLWRSIVLAASALVAVGALLFAIFRSPASDANEVSIGDVIVIDSGGNEFDVSSTTNIFVRAGTAVRFSVQDLPGEPGDARIVPQDSEAEGEQASLQRLTASWVASEKQFRIALKPGGESSGVEQLGKGRLRWTQADIDYMTPPLTFTALPALALEKEELKLRVGPESKSILGPWNGAQSPNKGLLVLDGEVLALVVEVPDPDELVRQAKLVLRPTEGPEATVDCNPVWNKSKAVTELRFSLTSGLAKELTGEVSLELRIKDRLGEPLPVTDVSTLALATEILLRSERPRALNVQLAGPGDARVAAVQASSGEALVCMPEAWLSQLDLVDLVVDLEDQLNPAFKRVLEFAWDANSKSDDGSWSAGQSGRAIRIPSAVFAQEGRAPSDDLQVSWSVTDPNFASSDPASVRYSGLANIRFLAFSPPTISLEGTPRRVQVLDPEERQLFAVRDRDSSLQVKASPATRKRDCSWWVRAQSSSAPADSAPLLARFEEDRQFLAIIPGLDWKAVGDSSLELQYFLTQESDGPPDDFDKRTPFRKESVRVTTLEERPLDLVANSTLDASSEAGPERIVQGALNALATRRNPSGELPDDGPNDIVIRASDEAPLEEVTARIIPLAEGQAAAVSVTVDERDDKHPGALLLSLEDILARMTDDGDYEVAIDATDIVGRAYVPSPEPLLVNRAGPKVVMEAGPPLGGRDWQPTLGKDLNEDYEIRLRANDGNGVDRIDVAVRWDSERGPSQERTPILDSDQAARGEGELVRSWSVPFEIEDSGHSGVLIVTATDVLGMKSNPQELRFKLSEVKPSFAPTIAGLPGKDDEVMMCLVQWRGEGDYIMAPDYLPEDPPQKARDAIRERLSQLGVFYDDPDIFSRLQESQEDNGMKPRTISGKSMPAACYLDAHEVSIGQYKAFLEDADGFGNQALWSRVKAPVEDREERRNALLGWVKGKDESLPMEGVTIEEAWCYAAWAGKRLPTYLEWELAMRGPLASRMFSLENAIPAPADRMRTVRTYDKATDSLKAIEASVYAEVGLGGPVSVTGGLGPNEQGFMHLGGNVSEWTCTPDVPLDVGQEASWAKNTLGPFEYGSGWDRVRYWWIVGASYGDMNPVYGTPIHDVRCARALPSSTVLNRNPKPIGFRCAIDATKARQVLAQYKAEKAGQR